MLIFLGILYTAQSQCTCNELESLSDCNSLQGCFWNGNVCAQAVCSQITNKSECVPSSGCMWTVNGCENSIGECAYILDKLKCGLIFGCIWNDNYCLDKMNYELCGYSTQSTCTGTTLKGLSCQWNNSTQNCFVYDTCNRLSRENCEAVGECTLEKNICKSIKTLGCSHLNNQNDCNRYNYFKCYWDKNKCIEQSCGYFTQETNCTQYGCNWVEGDCINCKSWSALLTLCLVLLY